MQALPHFLLVVRGLGTETKDLRTKLENFSMVIAKAARFGSAATGTRDFIPTRRKWHARAASQWIHVEHNQSRTGAEMNVIAGRGIQRQIGKASADKMRACSVIQRDGEIRGKLRKGAVVHRRPKLFGEQRSGTFSSTCLAGYLFGLSFSSVDFPQMISPGCTGHLNCPFSSRMSLPSTGSAWPSKKVMTPNPL